MFLTSNDLRGLGALGAPNYQQIAQQYGVMEAAQTMATTEGKNWYYLTPAQQQQFISRVGGTASDLKEEKNEASELTWGYARADGYATWDAVPDAKKREYVERARQYMIKYGGWKEDEPYKESYAEKFKRFWGVDWSPGDVIDAPLNFAKGLIKEYKPYVIGGAALLGLFAIWPIVSAIRSGSKAVGSKISKNPRRRAKRRGR